MGRTRNRAGNGVSAISTCRIEFSNLILGVSANERINAMNDTTGDLDRTDEETVTHDFSDEELEAAAKTTEASVTQVGYSTCSFSCL
jgi:hypothetical protein